MGLQSDIALILPLYKGRIIGGTERYCLQKGMVIDMAKMKVQFERCKGCGLCTTACPKKIVKVQTEKLNSKGYYTAVCIDEEACIGCALCATMCPDCAITVGGDDNA